MSKAYLLISLKIADPDRSEAAKVYSKYKQPFLDNIDGALSKELLIRKENVVVLHGFTTNNAAENYLSSDLFLKDVVSGLRSYLEDNPVIEIYSVV